MTRNGWMKAVFYLGLAAIIPMAVWLDVWRISARQAASVAFTPFIMLTVQAGSNLLFAIVLVLLVWGLIRLRVSWPVGALMALVGSVVFLGPVLGFSQVLPDFGALRTWLVAGRELTGLAGAFLAVLGVVGISRRDARSSRM